MAVIAIGQFTITDIFDGKDGQDGKSSYLWVKYSVNANGNPMTDNPTGALYIGVATTTTPTAPTSYTAYKWSLIKGADGIPGEKGQDGRTSYLHIKYSNDGGKTFTENNGETVGAWMGTYVDFTQADSTNPADYTWNKVKGEQGPQGLQGPKGADGQTLYTWVKYADSPTSGMSDTPDGKKYIGLAYNKTTPTESSNYADYQWSLIQGPQGVQGPKGADGVTTYTWVKYADDDKGTGMSDSPNGKRYLGLAYNKTTPTESTNPADYSWSPLYDNVKVDGRNFVRNADLVDNNNYWSFNGLNSYAYVENAYMNVRGLKTVRTGTTNVWAGMISTRGVKVKPGEQITLSVWYKVEVEADKLSIEVEYYGTADHTGTRLGTANVSLDRTVGDWRYGFGTFTVPNYSGDIYAYFRIYVVQSGTVTYCMPKLERGNIPTGFSIAQEDITERTDQAKLDAQNAQSTADGKNTVFYQAAAPSTVGRKINDLWYDTEDGHKPYYFNGSSWIPAPFGNAAIANLDAGKITTGYLSALRIAASSIEAKHIKSLNGLNVGNGQFVVDANGNVKFAGNLEGASGTFNGALTTNHLEIGPSSPDFPWYSDGSEIVSVLEMKNPIRISDGVYEWGQSFQIELLGNNNGVNLSYPGILNFNGGGAVCLNNTLRFNGVGVNECVEWIGGNNWKIYESPDDLTNGAGNLQFVTGSTRRARFTTKGKLELNGEGIEISWSGGTPYLDFKNSESDDYDARIIMQSDSSLAFMFDNDARIRHRFYANGTKSGGSIEIDGKNLGMSPIDSPQVLLETIEFDVPLTEQGTKVLLDSRFAKAVNYRFAVFQNNGRVIEKGPDYFIIIGEGLADIRIVGERVGYAGVYFDDMTMEGVV